MSRNFAPISIEDLMEKIKAFDDNYDLVEHLREDLKVNFDLENMDDSGGLCGYHTEANGFTYCGFSAGGDWEFPLFFLVYWDGKKLRAYVPTYGNPWNTDTKQAFGNDEDADLKNAKKRWPDRYVDEADPDFIPNLDDFPVDENLIRTDFMTRIVPVGYKAPVEKEVKAKPKVSSKPKTKFPGLIAKEIAEIRQRLDNLERIAAELAE